jgi:hypothetical protein
MKLILIMSIFFSVSVSSSENESLADEILDRSGINKQTIGLNDVLSQLSSSQKMGSKLSSEKMEKIQKIMVDALDGKKMLNDVKKNILKSFTLKELRELVVHYKLPLISKISRLEEDSSSPNGIQKLTEWAKGLQKNPPKEKRVNQVVDLIKTVGMQNLLKRFTLEIINQSLHFFHNKNMTAKEKSSIEEKIGTQLAQVTVIQMLYTYKDINDKNFQSYIDTNKKNKLIVRLNGIMLIHLERGLNSWVKTSFQQVNEFIKRPKK